MGGIRRPTRRSASVKQGAACHVVCTRRLRSFFLTAWALGHALALPCGAQRGAEGSSSSPARSRNLRASVNMPEEEDPREDSKLLWAADTLGALRRTNAELRRGLEKEHAQSKAVQQRVKSFVKKDLKRAKVQTKQILDLRKNNAILSEQLKKESKALKKKSSELQRERRHEAKYESAIHKLQDEASSLLLDKQSLMTTVKSLLSSQDASHKAAGAKEQQSGSQPAGNWTSLFAKVKEEELNVQAKNDAMYLLNFQISRLQGTVANLSAANTELKQIQRSQMDKFEKEQTKLQKKLKRGEAQHEQESRNSKALLANLRTLKAENGKLNTDVDKEIRQVDTISKLQAEKVQKLKATNQKLRSALESALNVSAGLKQVKESNEKQLSDLEEKYTVEVKLQTAEERNIRNENKKFRADLKKEQDDADELVKKEKKGLEAKVSRSENITKEKTKAMWALLKKNSDLRTTADELRSRNQELEEKNKKLTDTVRMFEQAAADVKDINLEVDDGAEPDGAAASDDSAATGARRDTQELAALDDDLKTRLESESSLD